MENTKEFNREVLTKNILTQKLSNQMCTIFYVGLFKESQTGLLYNQRMLVVDDKTFTIFYTKHFRPLAALLEMEKKGIKAIKEKLYIMNTTLQREENRITINFINDDNDQKNWIFKFYSNDLAQKWMFLYHELQQKCISKSIKTKQTKSTNQSQYNSILSNLKYDNFPSESLERQKEERRFYGEEKNKKVNVKKIEQNFNY